MAIIREHADGVTVLTMDDGRVNALDLDLFHALDSALDGCMDDSAIVLAGRPGMFSAGLNVKVMAGLDADGMEDLLTTFGRTMLRIWLEPRPVVAAVTGHAVAGGTILAMCCDHAVAAEGDYRWGLTETTIGFVMPQWVLAVARGNVATQHLDDLVLPGATVDPARAVTVGYADELAAPEVVVDTAVARARELAALPRAVYAATKRQLRGAAADAARDGMTGDLRAALALRT
ncbi:MAG: enoyl-CoA hydratase [Nitriliruptorales bacterium]|nr:enoyl-CoA hydratase [Nitriliruptorales bacterium]